jgi:hypothetical protein
MIFSFRRIGLCAESLSIWSSSFLFGHEELCLPGNDEEEAALEGQGSVVLH